MVQRAGLFVNSLHQHTPFLPHPYLLTLSNLLKS